MRSHLNSGLESSGLVLQVVSYKVHCLHAVFHSLKIKEIKPLKIKLKFMILLSIWAEVKNFSNPHMNLLGVIFSLKDQSPCV